mgnify:FL=1
MEVGTDINSKWTLTNDGDLKIVNDEENMVQSIGNRLSCYQPSMEVYYEQYGGFLTSYLGQRKTSETLDFMKIEIDTMLKQDPRIEEFTSTLSYSEKGVNVILKLIVACEEMEVDLIVDDGGGVTVAD